MHPNSPTATPMKDSFKRGASMLYSTVRLWAILFSLLFVGGMQVWGFSFQSIYFGKTIYYNITSNTAPYQVMVTYGSTPNAYLGSIIIPGTVTYNGNLYSVTSVGDSAFFGCVGISSVTLPDGISHIGNHAFNGCTNLDTLLIQATAPPSIDTSSFNYADFGGIIVAVPCHSLSSYRADSIWNRCDTIITLTLHTYINTTTCQQLLWGDTLYTNSGTYLRRFANSNGCDSLVTLNLTIKHAYYDTVLIDTCGPFFWSGQYISSDTTLNDIRQTTAGCDSIKTIHLHFYPSYHDTTAVTVCNSYDWQGIHYTSFNNHGYTIDTALILHTIWGCDSILQLHLTMHSNTTTHQTATSCDQYTWPISGETYFMGGTYTHTIPNAAGCDSIITLNLNIVMSHISEFVDSFCTGTPYYFYGEELTRGGYYSQTFTSTVAPYCDSVEILYLTELNKPVITIITHYSCDTLKYKIYGNTNVDYFYWTSNNNDQALEGQEHQRQLILNPIRPTQYTFHADYLNTTTCPNSKTITLTPLRRPEASMEISPEQLNLNQLNFTAIDHSTDNTSRNWYVDGCYYGTATSITYTTPTDADSVTLRLEAFNDHCSDTVYKTLYVRKESLYIPNAFTPKENTNNLFMVKGNGITQYEIHIYSRNGQMVFHSTNMDEGWDGTTHSNQCPSGAYTYIIHYHDVVEPRNPKQVSGSILLVR